MHLGNETRSERRASVGACATRANHAMLTHGGASTSQPNWLTVSGERANKLRMRCVARVHPRLVGRWSVVMV